MKGSNYEQGEGFEKSKLVQIMIEPLNNSINCSCMNKIDSDDNNVECASACVALVIHVKKVREKSEMCWWRVNSSSRIWFWHVFRVTS